MDDIRRTFHQHLREVETDIVRLAAMATETIPRATAALLDRDLPATQQLIDDDDEIDVLTHDIEERIYDLIVRQGPVASDLRTLLTSLWMTSEIERSADLATNIAKGTRRIYDIELHPVARGLISQMSEEATRLFRLAIEAYVEREAGLAAALDDIDDRVDQLHGEFIQSLFEHQSDSGLQPAVQLALIGRYYERIGDHAVNMGERVGYMVTGSLPEAGSPLDEHDERGADTDGGRPRAVENDADDPDPAGS
jgi:phosphate transport system protein